MLCSILPFFFFFFNDTATTEIYTLSLHDALPIYSKQLRIEQVRELAQELSLTSHQGGYKVGILSPADSMNRFAANRSEEHTSELQSRQYLVCRLLLEKKKKKKQIKQYLLIDSL